MSDDLKKTVRIVRKPKVALDEHGHSVWTDTVETVELDLVSTTMLKKLLDSEDDRTRRRIEKVARGKDGVLAHNAASGSFEIIDDEDLQAALESAAGSTEQPRPADVTLEPLREDTDEELSLVSTQMLRQILAGEEPAEPGDAAEDVDPGGGFDPYNSS